jgi:exonuclease SbcC
MSVRVRIQNFQSIEDASIEVDGFTVVTGPNNSGKSALMRAIRGVFTNAPAGALVRHGTSHLTVDLAFDDGVVRWEKGKNLNRYTVNGKVLDNVGRGVPSEVADMGLQEVKAASDRLWPQIAEQFGGVLFLVDRPGSVVAEALSDVERVGKLSDALRLSESDRRSTTAELKIRRKDALELVEEEAAFEGLDEVAVAIGALAEAEKELVFVEMEVQEFSRLRERLEASHSVVSSLEGFDPEALPNVSAASEVQQLQVELREARALVDQLAASRGAVAQAEAAVAASEKHPLSRSHKVEKVARGMKQVRDLQARLAKASKETEALAVTHKNMEQQLVDAEEEVHALLGDRGICPTCDAVFEKEEDT